MAIYGNKKILTTITVMIFESKMKYISERSLWILFLILNKVIDVFPQGIPYDF